MGVKFPPQFRSQFSLDRSLSLWVLQRLGHALLCLFPLCMLNWHHSANTIYLSLALVAILSVLMAYLCRSSLDQTVPISWLGVCLMYPLALLIQSLVLGQWTARAWDIPSRLILALPILYFLLSLKLDQLKQVSHFAVAGAWWAFIASAYQAGLNEDGRASTYFMHPTSFGNLVWILSILCWGAYEGSWRQRAWALSGVLAGILAAYGSATRAAWLAIIVSAVMAIAWQRAISQRMKYGVMLLLLALVLSTYFSVASVRERVNLGWYELTQELTEVADTSVGLRRQYWWASMQMIQDHPLVGVGRFQFAKEKDRMVDAGVLTQAAKQYEHPHNELLFAWSELGILGLLGVLLLYLVPGYFFWQQVRSEHRLIRHWALIGGMVVVSYVVFGMVDVMLMAWVMQVPVYVVSVALPMAVILVKRRQYL